MEGANRMTWSKRVASILFAAVLLLTACPVAFAAQPLQRTAPAAVDKILVDGTRFVDSAGRTRIFHGVNVVGKGNTSYVLDALLSKKEDYFSKMNALGFNMLRLGTTWAELEPEPDVYNTDLMDKIGEVFDRAAGYGIYVYLDLHQDLWSASIGGDGAPAWATITDGKENKRIPIISDFAGWGADYLFGAKLQTAFSHFWNNDVAGGKGLQDHYAELWTMLAQRYGSKPAFFGFDFLNEPHPGKRGVWIVVQKLIVGILTIPFLPQQWIDVLSKYLSKTPEDELRMLASVDRKLIAATANTGALTQFIFDQTKYAAFQNKMTSAVRAVTPNGVVMLEHGYFAGWGTPYYPKLPQVNNKTEEQTIYSPHIYDLLVDQTANNFTNVDRPLYLLDQIRKTQKRIKTPVLVGEWGAGYMLHTAINPKAFEQLEIQQDYFDANGWSNTYWGNSAQYIFYEEAVPYLSRPYPMAVNGTASAFKYNRAANAFTLEYTQPAGANANLPTIVYLPKAYKTITASSGLTVQSQAIAGADAQHLLITGTPGKHKLTVQF
jgi:endoglycosylceramidase